MPVLSESDFESPAGDCWSRHYERIEEKVQPHSPSGSQSMQGFVVPGPAIGAVRGGQSPATWTALMSDQAGNTPQRYDAKLIIEVRGIESVRGQEDYKKKWHWEGLRPDIYMYDLMRCPRFRICSAIEVDLEGPG